MLGKHRLFKLKNMNPVILFEFEIPVDDKRRAADFYARAFGWTTKPVDPDPKVAVPITTADLNTKANLPTALGRINGEFYQRTNDPLLRPPAVVIAVDNLNDSMKKIEMAGGKIYGDPLELPEGVYSSVIDTEGNRIGMIQLRLK